MKKVADRHVHPMGLSSHSFSLLNETRISMVGVPSLPPAQEVIFKWQRKVEKPPAFAPAAIPLPGTQQSGRWSVLTNLLRRPAPSTPPPAQPSDQATLEKPRFYTYVDSDGYVDKEVQDRHYTTARRELASPLARKVLSPIYERENVIDPKMPHINAHSPHHINHHTVLHKDEIMNASCKEMHLMAYILYEVWRAVLQKNSKDGDFSNASVRKAALHHQVLRQRRHYYDAGTIR
ncbi:hypothetical protein DFJ73DRAFT_540955 [Zopfochytrium polystomum]|nr:hypothetical protein DFJ73DRAFT_540955 [Zopfochytrium polystomum]